MVIDKKNYSRNCPKFQKLIKIVIIKRIIGKRKTNCFYPINFMVGTCKEPTFSFLTLVKSYRARAVVII